MDQVLGIWQQVVSEAVGEQIQEGPNRGLVRNFLVDGFYHRETAFAAKIFATEYLRTGSIRFLDRATMALGSLQKVLGDVNICEGLDEPNWTPRGLRYRKGSIPSTVLLLYAAQEAASLIGYDFKYDMNGVLDFLERCYLGHGRFYHDRLDLNSGGARYHVVNTTAMSYWFIQLAHAQGIRSALYTDEIAVIENAICRSQRSDGFWSYLEPNVLQRLYWKVAPYLPRRFTTVYNRVLGDASIWFGDALHHTVCMYYYLAGKRKACQSLRSREKRAIRKGWLFIRDKLTENTKGQISIDFSWEPKPTRLRYCNFVDTSTYFYILDLLPTLEYFEVIDAEEKEKCVNGIIMHIHYKLLTSDRPCVKPYEGGEDVIQYIIPRPAESIFDKGFLFCDTVLNRLGQYE
jgi:hypothetical protein